tara:strand:- start:96 stop:1037 length:942 start_codon:yes stop_codon:yes gene_type:complete
MNKLIFLVSWIAFALTTQAKAEIIKGNCLIDEYYLESEKIDKSEQRVLAGKVIKLEIDTEKKLVIDKSDVKRIIILTGIPEEGVKYEGSSYITYQNQLNIIDQEKDREFKYTYNNSILLENNEISQLSVDIDQTGISLNKWEFYIKCRSYKYTDTEKKIARRSFLSEDKSTNPKYKIGDLTPRTLTEEEVEKGKSNLSAHKFPDKEDTIPKNFILDVDINIKDREYALYLVEPKDANDLLNFYKAKLFDNDKDVSLMLGNRNYLSFKKYQRIFYEDIKHLDERKFFRIPLEDSMDRHMLKIYKKEYFKEKKKL